MRWLCDKKLGWAWLAALLILTGGRQTLAQDPSPPLPSPTVPPDAGMPPGASREAQLEERVRQLERMVNQLSNQINAMPAAGAPPAAAPAAGSVGAPATPADPGLAGDTAPRDSGTPATANAPSSSGGTSGPGQSLPPNPTPSARFNSPATLESKKANVKFGPGFEIRSDDDEFIFQFHNLTQVDYRGFQQGGQDPVHNSFLFPRQWFMFSGRITKPFGYFVSFANGFDTLGLLDAFIDYDYDPRLRLRVGRMKTPFTYEFLIEPIQGLMTPERSLFFNNFGQNRDLGIMASGRLFENHLDYAAGIYNGSRNGYIDQNDAKHVSAFVNYKPFGHMTDSALENFNVGGSVFAGNAHQLPSPLIFRTAVPTSGNPIVGVPFLGLRAGIREEGFQGLWDLHFAYYYKQLAVIGEWGSGSQGYAPATNPRNRTRVPVDSYYLQAGYLLTGETRSSVGIVKPDHPFNLKDGEFGLGAWEVTGRYDYLNVGKQVFTSGLADRSIWSNSLYMVDLGLNWHLTQYVKVYFDWEHAVFGDPVLFAPNRLQKTSDLFMVRFQLFF